MAKDKKKKKKDKKQKSSLAETAVRNLKALSDNPLVADVVTAALVGTAAALKDSKTARQLAAHAGDELEALAKGSAERGNAMWKLALDVGKRALDTLVSEEPAPKASRAGKATKAPKAPKAPKAAKPAKAPATPKARSSRSKTGGKAKAKA